jgi:hypothetical protein
MYIHSRYKDSKLIYSAENHLSRCRHSRESYSGNIVIQVERGEGRLR